MKNRAFTLIELLVVVLIIGILTSIAVPKYKTAVKTSKLKSVLPIIKSIAQAEQAYFLANGTYTKNLADLDVNVAYDSSSSIPGYSYSSYNTSWGGFALYAGSGYDYMTFGVTDVAQIDIFYNFPKQCAYCYRDNDEVCHKFGVKIENRDEYKICQF